MSETARNELCSCGSGLKYKRCCLLKAAAAPLFAGPDKGNPRPAFLDDMELVYPKPKPRTRMQPVERVCVYYTFPESFGEANVWYLFPVERLIFLEWGQVVTAKQLRVGMRF